MDNHRYAEHVQTMLTVFNSLAPTGQTIRAVADVLHHMRKEGADDKELIIQIAYEITEGLEHRRWRL